MSYLRYLLLLTYSGVQLILCCVFGWLFFVLCCQFLWIVLSLLSLRYSLALKDVMRSRTSIEDRHYNTWPPKRTKGQITIYKTIQQCVLSSSVFFPDDKLHQCIISRGIIALGYFFHANPNPYPNPNPNQKFNNTNNVHSLYTQKGRKVK